MIQRVGEVTDSTLPVLIRIGLQLNTKYSERPKTKRQRGKQHLELPVLILKRELTGRKIISPELPAQGSNNSVRQDQIRQKSQRKTSWFTVMYTAAFSSKNHFIIQNGTEF
jgi:hypothetical protein